MKIERDQRRFRQIVRGKIRENLRKYITHGEMIGRKGRDLVSIPLPQLDVPHFRYGKNGSRRRRAGRWRRRPADRPSGGEPKDGKGQAGSDPGGGTSSKSMSRSRSWPQILGEELELPRIEPKGKANIEQEKVASTPASAAVGPGIAAALQADLHAKRCSGRSRPAVRAATTRASCRSARTSSIAPGTRSTQPQANAVDHLHDGRLRLDDRRAEGDRPHRGVLDRYLAREPVRRRRDALHHPRRGGQGSRRAHVLSHPRKRRHADQLGLQGVRRADRRTVSAGGVEHLLLPVLRRRQLGRRQRAKRSSCLREKLLPT